MYTLAVDMLVRGLETDKDGVASAADLFACNKRSNGELAKLLSNRSLANLKRGDHSAAVEDADACVKADTTVEKGHLRLVLALEASGASLQDQLEVCERGLAACPDVSSPTSLPPHLTLHCDAWEHVRGKHTYSAMGGRVLCSGAAGIG